VESLARVCPLAVWDTKGAKLNYALSPCCSRSIVQSSLLPKLPYPSRRSLYFPINENLKVREPERIITKFPQSLLTKTTILGYFFPFF
jgi:hypothetical protein